MCRSEGSAARPKIKMKAVRHPYFPIRTSRPDRAFSPAAAIRAAKRIFLFPNLPPCLAIPAAAKPAIFLAFSTLTLHPFLTLFVKLLHATDYGKKKNPFRENNFCSPKAVW